jgi:hypothetical protein
MFCGWEASVFDKREVLTFKACNIKQLKHFKLMQNSEGDHLATL